MYVQSGHGFSTSGQGWYQLLAITITTTTITIAVTTLPRLPTTGLNAFVLIPGKFSTAVKLVPGMTLGQRGNGLPSTLPWYILRGAFRRCLSDRDAKFIGDFWKNLFSAVGTTLAITTDYHPSADGQAERTNTVDTMLRYSDLLQTPTRYPPYGQPYFRKSDSSWIVCRSFVYTSQQTPPKISQKINHNQWPHHNILWRGQLCKSANDVAERSRKLRQLLS